ncbi:phosphoribosylaminoimidazolesuccinocarboxamide synthase [Armatimonas rosea]|uniref:Phosphoribosylaminoimidazole-succinocarboxamide synthase n=1 Tax=Armatimonas rosea TaxID=685828 RepID=A0A7W9SRA4_ARMRO|nr:phosphoribosylaminoimidazole-succinocarboxamide synthase [Armatimonas rosea]
MSAVLTTNIAGLTKLGQGKVRDLYAVGDDKLLLVASDRISAFDVVMAQGIPGKGRILTQLSVFWFAQTQGVIANHLITADDTEIAAEIAAVGGVWDETLAGRAMLCKRTRPLKIEAVIRGYLSGSGWKAYKTDGPSLWGNPLPAGLVESDKLPTPIFTPSTKADAGHDEPMTPGEAKALLGEHFDAVVSAAQGLYAFALAHAEKRGIILADTKFEFGLDENDKVILIDEALTPDSSRFWPADTYQPGGAQPSFDKQFLRDFLESVPGWNKQPPPPDLPAEIIAKTAQKYEEAWRRLTE